MEYEDTSASWEVGKLKEEMRRNKVDVMGTSEVRWEQSGELMSDEFRMFYSSDDAKVSQGFGVVLGPHVRDKVISVRYVDNQMIMVEDTIEKSGLSDSANLHAT